MVAGPGSHTAFQGNTELADLLDRARDQARRLSAGQRRQQQLLDAMAAVATAVATVRAGAEPAGRRAASPDGPPHPGQVVFDTVARAARRLAASDLALLAVPTGSDCVRIEAATGTAAAELAGRIVPLPVAALCRAAAGQGPAVLVEDAGPTQSPLLAGCPVGPALAVPLRAGGRALGGLLVANPPGTARFGPVDAEIVGAFAGHAALAVAIVEYRTETERRQVRLAASVDAMTALLTEPRSQALVTVAARLRQATGAEVTLLEVPSGTDGVAIAAVDGPGTEQFRGRVVPLAGAPLFTAAITAGRPVVVDDGSRDDRVVGSAELAGRPVGPVLAVPLHGNPEPLGAVVLAHPPGAAPFTPAEIHLVATFARHTETALAFIDRQQDDERAARAEDRRNVADELHDGPIQRLFVAGIQLHSLSGRLGGTPEAARLAEIATELDDTLRDLRTIVFASRALDT